MALAESVLVGRDREFEELQRHLDLAIKGKGSTVFVCGEAGSGKTRLANEFLNAAKKNGVIILSGWCLGQRFSSLFSICRGFRILLR